MLNVGLIGCGFIAKKHITSLARLKGRVSLVAVSDIDSEKMDDIISLYQTKLKEKKQIKQFKNYYDLLDLPYIDLVIIAVSSSLHAKSATEALNKGKHVIVEKPLALSSHDIDELTQLSIDVQKQVFVCHQLRYKPLMKEIKRLIQLGYFGELYYGEISMRLHRSQDYYKASPWKGTWEHDGGLLVNQGIHLIDLLVWFLGEVDHVYGELIEHSRYKETEDVAAGIITFKNKSRGLIEANTISQPHNVGYELSLFGEKGTICIEGKNLDTITHCYFADNSHISLSLRELSADNQEHVYMYEDIIRAVEENTSTLINAAKVKESLDTIFALYMSDRKGQRIQVPLKEFSTKEMKRIDNGGSFQ